MAFNESEKRTEALPHRLESPENPSQSVLPSSQQMKTRDLPNLTECHACGFKVDVCTGKNKLRTLYSEWRIVLLCNKCFSSVESSQICSYCFSGASSECFRCTQCRHSVHKSCFFKYKNVAPWSYSCLGSEFSVCVDCWIPKPLEVARRRTRKLRSGMIEKKGKVVLEKGVSRVFEDGNMARSMEDMVTDANCAVEKKAEAATRVRVVAMKKAVLAKRGVVLANNALSLVKNRENSAPNLLPKMDPVKVVGDSEFTFDLHSNLNRIRISKSCCLLDTGSLDVPKRWSFSVDSSCKATNSRNASGCGDGHEVSNGDKLYGDSHKSFWGPSVSIGSLDTDSSTGQNHHCMGRSYMKTSPKFAKYNAKFNVEDIGEELLKEGEGGCSEQLINKSGEDCGFQLDRKQTDCSLRGVERPTAHPDRYFSKYSRRNRLKPNLDCLLRGVERPTAHPDRYFSKYSRRNRLKPNLEYIAEFNVEEAGEEMFKEGERSSDWLINLSREDSRLEFDRKQTYCSLQGEEQPNARPDRYFFKYHRKNGLKRNLECIAEFDVEETGEEIVKERERSSDQLIKLSREDSGLELEHKQTDCSLHGEERPNARPDRYFLKYRRRNGLKPNLERIAEFEVEVIGEEMLKEGEGSCSDRLINSSGEDSGLELDCKQTDCSLNGEEQPISRPDGYFLKYSRRNGLKPNLGSRPRVFDNEICLESQDLIV